MIKLHCRSIRCLVSCCKLQVDFRLLFCFLWFLSDVLPIRKLVQADLILSQPLFSPQFMISIGILDQIFGKMPWKLRLYTSKDLVRTFETTWMPSRDCLVRFLHNLIGSINTGVKVLSSPRASPLSILSAMAITAASRLDCKDSTPKPPIFSADRWTLSTLYPVYRGVIVQLPSV